MAAGKPRKSRGSHFRPEEPENVVGDGCTIATFCLSSVVFAGTCLARQPGATFGERLKAHRLASGLTQQELADATDTYPQEISCYERDETEPTWRTVAALVRVLGVGLVDVR